MGAVASVPAADILNQSPFTVLPGQTGVLHSPGEKGTEVLLTYLPTRTSFPYQTPSDPIYYLDSLVGH